MRVVFDLTNSKDVVFFRPMIRRLRAAGCHVSLVTRDWEEVNVMRRRFRMRATSLGTYGGESLLGKLRSSSERVRLLARYFARHRPDVVVTLTHPDSARAAFGLQIPIVCFADIPEAWATARLTFPLASKVCAPWIIPPREFVRYGVAPEDLFFYRALDPALWLTDYIVDEKYLDTLGLDSAQPLVVCRETEWQSAYATGDIVGKVVEQLRRRHPGWQFIDIPRYRSHPFFDVPSLLARAHLLIGGGGTMCIEAAYYGTPAIATRPSPSRYMQWLFGRRLAVQCLSVPDAVQQADAIIARRGSQRAGAARRRAQRIFKRMRFPLQRVVDLILRTAERRRSALT
jgi:uncharacterized protein